MRSSGVLVDKEQAKSNFKLTFENEQGQSHLFLNQSKEIIFNNLEIGSKYTFSISKGIKDYYFLNPQSLKIVNTNHHINETKDFYYNKLCKEIGVKKLEEKDIRAKIDNLKDFSKRMRNQKDREFLLVLIKEAITSFYLKYRALGIRGQPTSKEEEQEEELLLDIETMLFFDRFYNKKN